MASKRNLDNVIATSGQIPRPSRVQALRKAVKSIPQRCKISSLHFVKKLTNWRRKFVKTATKGRRVNGRGKIDNACTPSPEIFEQVISLPETTLPIEVEIIMDSCPGAALGGGGMPGVLLGAQVETLQSECAVDPSGSIPLCEEQETVECREATIYGSNEIAESVDQPESRTQRSPTQQFATPPRRENASEPLFVRKVEDIKPATTSLEVDPEIGHRDAITNLQPTTYADQPTKALYDVLDKSRPLIRLLQITSLDSEENKSKIIQCQLVTVSLGSNPEYVALSYVWGSAENKTNIILNGEVASVTRNLGHALQQLRVTILGRNKLWEKVKDFPPLFWVDAICINQDDISERNHQAQQMGSIYSRASLVISWLGPDDDGKMGSAMAALGVLNEGLDLSKYFAKSHLGALSFLASKHPWLEKSDWQLNLNMVFSNQYWGRVWILQEIALASELWIVSGGTSINLTALQEFRRIADSTTNSYVPDADDDDRETLVSSLTFISETTRNWKIGQFVDYFNRARRGDEFKDNTVERLQRCVAGLLLSIGCDATDPRDKIYALQGLSGNIINPDYNRPTGDVYFELSREYISKSQRLDLLHLCGEGFGCAKQFGIPSWVVDWHARQKLAIAEGFNEALRGFRANEGIEKHCTSELLISERGSERVSQSSISSRFCLKASGCVCNVVTDIEPDYNTTQGKLFNLCLSYVSRKGKKKYPTGVLPLEAILRTMICDCYAFEGKTRLTESNSVEMQHVLLTLLALLVDLRTRHGGDGHSMNGYQEEKSAGNEIGQRVFWALEELNATTDFFAKLQLPMALTEDPSSLVKDLSKFVGIGMVSAFEAVSFVSSRKCLYHTSDGYLGVGPKGAAVGDLICVLMGCPFPVLLRKEKSHYIHVGPSFVLGLMEGEAAKLVEEGRYKVEVFDIF